MTENEAIEELREASDSEAGCGAAEVISILKKAVDNISKVLDEFCKSFEELPEYLKKEMLHYKKKPRGSIRRARKEIANDGRKGD